MEKLWTYEDLMIRYGVGERQIRRVCERMGLKPLKLGHRTVRFRPCAVVAAEEAVERGQRGTPRRRATLVDFGKESGGRSQEM